MKRLIALMLALCLVLCGCSGGGDSETTGGTQPQETTTPAADTTAPAEEITEPAGETTEPVDNTQLQYINPLTGEAAEEPFTARPLAIMLNNHHVALPHCGVSEADIVYEVCVEGGMTRYMAIFTNLESAGAIGSVRSTRPPFVDLVQAYDAIYCSASGDDRVLATIKSANIDYINALVYGSFYRDSWRQANMGFEHSLMIEGADLKKLADSKFTTTVEPGTSYGMNFDESVPFIGEEANAVTIYFTAGGKTTTATYSESLGGYTLNQYSMNYTDGNTGEKVVFRNVLILTTNHYSINDGTHIMMDTVGSGTGYYLRDGQIAQINWSRDSAAEPFTYTYADGTEVLFGVGTTYVAVQSDAASITVK